MTAAPMSWFEHLCRWCQQPFRSPRQDAAYCSGACRYQGERQRRRQPLRAPRVADRAAQG
jgi:hypothetical protein